MISLREYQTSSIKAIHAWFRAREGNPLIVLPTGSGSTGKACALEGFRFIGIEREAEYLEIARARIAIAEADAAAPRQASLFEKAKA